MFESCSWPLNHLESSILSSCFSISVVIISTLVWSGRQFEEFPQLFLLCLHLCWGVCVFWLVASSIFCIVLFLSESCWWWVIFTWFVFREIVYCSNNCGDLIKVLVGATSKDTVLLAHMSCEV